MFLLLLWTLHIMLHLLLILFRNRQFDLTYLFLYCDAKLNLHLYKTPWLALALKKLELSVYKRQITKILIPKPEYYPKLIVIINLC